MSAAISASLFLPADFSLVLRPVSSPFDGEASCAYEFEAQCAGDRGRLDQFNRDRVAEPVRRRVADEGATSFVVTEIFFADVTRRDQTVGAGLVEFDEQAGAGHSGDVAIEGRADAIDQKMRDQPVGGLALGLHGAALSR